MAYLIYEKILLTVFILFLVLFTASKIEATRGCCSYHSGVCGCDTNVGRQVCCDGTYSPSCTCAYIPPAPTFPPDTKAEWNFYANENGTWNIKMNVLDNNPTKYSAVISKCAGCDPGPLVDFYSNDFTFNNIYPGKWYVNVKKEINGYWSNTVYWAVDVPQWQAPTPTSAILINNSLENPTENTTDYSPLIKIVAGVIIGGLIARFITKKIDKPHG